MKNSILFAILLASDSIISTNASASSPRFDLDGLNCIKALPLVSTSDDVSASGVLTNTHLIQTSGNQGFRRLLLMLIPASLLGILYIIVKKQKLYIEATPSSASLDAKQPHFANCLFTGKLGVA